MWTSQWDQEQDQIAVGKLPVLVYPSYTPPPHAFHTMIEAVERQKKSEDSKRGSAELSIHVIY